MNENNSHNKAEAYSNPFEHISDICRITRSCLENKDPDTANELMSELDGLRLREDNTSDTELPVVLIRERFGLTGFEYFCVLVGILFALEGDGKSPSFAQAVSRYPFAESENVYSALISGAPLGFLLDKEEGCGISPCFRLKSFVFDFIIGNVVSARNIFWENDPDELPILFEEQYERGVDFISGAQNQDIMLCVIIEGKPGSGRRTLAAQISRSFGKQTAAVRAEDIKDGEDFAKELTGSCVLMGSVPVLTADEDAEKAAALVKLMTLLPVVFICVSSGEGRFELRGRKRLFLRIPPLDRETRFRAWTYYLDGSEIDAKALAERYRLTVGQIAEVCGSPKANDMRDLTNRIMSLNSESSVCSLIRPMFRLEDLAAQDHITDALKRIISTAERLPGLMENSGFGRLFPYGKGLGILFYGASGTGKTMSAYILAAELGLEVMRVDISRIEDKYIGETEKRISEVFQKAKENNCLLFFDEADSLFAKRTEVTDSHDRHANAQTAHLLQKIEEYDGIVVLATNLSENIDPAFRRRLHFIVEFLKPDEAARGKLWRKFIPDELPRGELDYEFLAGTFELTPAEIKWAALSAAVLANGEPLSTGHIITALRYEYEKSGVAFPNISYRKICLGEV